MTIQLRANRTAFAISGADASRLLHDVLTPPVVAEREATRWFALLSPQGKIAAEGLIGWTEDTYWLDVDDSVAAFFAKRMAMYRLRAKVEITPLGETHRVGWSDSPAPIGIVHADPRGAGLGHRVIAPIAETGSWQEGTGQAQARIGYGVSEMGSEFGPDDTFPHDIGMDLLGAIDFKKGCYIGQEVVSRMQHRGTARRRPVLVEGIGVAQSGDSVAIGERSVGQIGQPVDGKAVAIVRIDKIEDPQSASVNGTPVTLALPQWARYAFGAPGGDSGH